MTSAFCHEELYSVGLRLGMTNPNTDTPASLARWLEILNRGRTAAGKTIRPQKTEDHTKTYSFADGQKPRATNGGVRCGSLLPNTGRLGAGHLWGSTGDSTRTLVRNSPPPDISGGKVSTPPCRCCDACRVTVGRRATNQRDE